MDVVCVKNHITLFVFVLLLNSITCSIYSEGLNRDVKHADRPFRTAKVNMVWEKAKLRISGTQLADLYADLKVHDKEQLLLKKIKVENLDEDGMKEAGVNVNFRRIIQKYHLTEHFKSDKQYIDGENELPHGALNDKLLEFSDKKLQKIWSKALMSGFDAEELDKLRQEFFHQQMKLDEYNALHIELGDIGGTFDNSVESIKDKTHDPEIALTKNANLKHMHRKIKDGYLRLEGLTANDDPDIQDPRVYQLWALAKKANMSDSELESFKKELKNFEHRISKHEHMKEQLHYSKLALSDEEKQHNPEKHTDLQDKEKNYGHKVKKLHADLNKIVEKAMQQHTEL